MGALQSVHLSAAHREMIEASAVTPEVALERDYKTIRVKARLRELGFSQAQAQVPCLLIPVRGLDGGIVSYQARPDEPRIRDGKPIKYETPRGSSMVVDIPPRARPHLGDPSRPLFITEGVRKADAGVSAGLCCIGLLGVWNWRGTNSAGGKCALPEWDSIALNDRKRNALLSLPELPTDEMVQATGTDSGPTGVPVSRAVSSSLTSPPRSRVNSPGRKLGGVAERLKAAVLKTAVGQLTGGSNPSASASTARSVAIRALAGRGSNVGSARGLLLWSRPLQGPQTSNAIPPLRLDWNGSGGSRNHHWP